MQNRTRLNTDASARGCLSALGRRTALATAVSLAMGGPALAANIGVGGSCTLVDAITAANSDSATGGCLAGSGADTIILPASSTQTLTVVNNITDGPNGLPSVTSTITIQGNNSIIERSSAGGTPEFRIFYVAGSGDLTLDEVAVRNGLTPQGPFGSSGGGLFVNGGVATLTNSNVLDNSARSCGGGLYVSDGTVTVTNSTISGNNASSCAGGGLFIQDGNITLTNSTVSGNTGRDGGGLRNTSGTVILTNTTVSGNSVLLTGGGLHNIFGTIALIDCSVSDNTAETAGGGLHNSGTLTLINTAVTDNSAGNRGGGLFIFSGAVSLTDSTISGNSAVRMGGGLYKRYGPLTLTNSTVSGNSAEEGGGLMNFDDTVTLTNTTLSNNSARDAGGGLGNTLGTITLTNSTISGNTAGDLGGGLYNWNGSLTLSNSLVANSTNEDCSGAITDNGHNWFEDDTCNGTVQGDPKLGPLADNGGPTLTQALLDGSGAIDAGDNGVCAAPPVNRLDQRGEPRPGGDSSSCDIGAFEVQQSQPPPEPPGSVPALSFFGLWSLLGVLLGIGTARVRRLHGAGRQRRR